MISFDSQRRVFVSTRPVDFRTGVHGLVARVATALGGDPYPHSGDVFVFRAKRKDRLKLLFFDGSGMVVARQSGWKRGSEQEDQFGGRGEEMIVAARQ